MLLRRHRRRRDHSKQYLDLETVRNAEPDHLSEDGEGPRVVVVVVEYDRLKGRVGGIRSQLNAVVEFMNALYGSG